EGVAGEALREHAVETHESAFGIVAAERVQRVAGAVKGVDAVAAGPKIELASAGAEHAHAKATVLFEIAGYPILLFAADRKNAAGDGVTDDDVPVTADADFADWVVNGLVVVEGNRHEGRSGFAPRTF